MNTLLILMAQFGARTAIPVEEVRREYFSHLEIDKFMRKLSSRDIPLPVTRVDKSFKSAKFVSIMDLVVFLDTQMEAGRKEYEELRRAAGSSPDAKQRFAELMFKRSLV